MDDAAVVQDVTALHVSVAHGSDGAVSVSTQIGLLRKLLEGNEGEGEIRKWFKAVADVRSSVEVNLILISDAYNTKNRALSH